MNEYGEHYSEGSFWQKVKRFALTAGRRVIGNALILYYCLMDSDTPPWAKTVIVGALGYFIFPMDAIPDAVPVVGYTDDLETLALALGMVAIHVKPEHREKAEEKLRVWFG